MSQKLGRPVMMRITRIEEYAIGSARPTFQGYAKLGFREDGRMTAADLYIVHENGPHIGGGDFRSAGNALSLLYQPLAMGWRAIPVLTNTPPRGPQRGPGENQLVPAIEPMIDKAARQLGVDRVAIRKINAPDAAGKIGSDQGPVTSAFMKEALDQGAQLFNWEEKKKLSGQRNGNKVIGIGVGQGYHNAERMASTVFCGSPRTASCMCIRGSAISAPIRIRRRAGLRPNSSTTIGKM
jgi:xanthine dehydrogenase molybdenum-binding subunit